jgi:TetR/AcrR family transcriptional repressor of nem operon
MIPFRSVVGTQARIVALAVYQLKNGGYEELHFGAIASALGVTRANIHHHFSSKDNLARLALEEFIEDRLCRLQAMIERYPSDFPSALNSIGEYLQKLLLLNNTGVPPSLKEVSQDYFKELSVLFQATIEKSQQAGTVEESVNAQDLAWECVLLMMGIGVFSGSLGVHELAHHPAPRLLKKKAQQIGAFSQDFLRAG